MDNNVLDKKYFEINHSGGGITYWSFYPIKQGTLRCISKANKREFCDLPWDQLLLDLVQRQQTSFGGHKQR